MLGHKGGAELLNRKQPELGTHLLARGKSLQEYYAICSREPRRMSQGASEHLGHVTDTCVRSWVRAGLPMTMKAHCFSSHFQSQAAWSGNPLFTHNYADESENYGSRIRSFGLYRPTFAEKWLTTWMMEFLLEINT
eukprot:9366720-Pyramimonas_sp.AAC.1